MMMVTMPKSTHMNVVYQIVIFKQYTSFEPIPVALISTADIHAAIDTRNYFLFVLHWSAEVYTLEVSSIVNFFNLAIKYHQRYQVSYRVLALPVA